MTAGAPNAVPTRCDVNIVTQHSRLSPIGPDAKKIFLVEPLDGLKIYPRTTGGKPEACKYSPFL